MNTPNRGSEPAMPMDWKDFQPETGIQVVREQYSGLTIREHFAGLAMNAIISQEDESWHVKDKLDGTMTRETIIAKLATKQADALIAELEKKSK